MNTQNNAQESIGNSQAPHIYDHGFSYTPEANTDVMKTFKRFGFQEPDRDRQLQVKRSLNNLS